MTQQCSNENNIITAGDMRSGREFMKRFVVLKIVELTQPTGDLIKQRVCVVI